MCQANHKTSVIIVVKDDLTRITAGKHGREGRLYFRRDAIIIESLNKNTVY